MARTSKKMTDLQKVWMDRINRSKKVRTAWKEQFRVDMAKRFFDGDHNIHGFAEEDWISVPKVYSYVKSVLPRLYSHNPYCYINLRKCYKVSNGDLNETMQTIDGMEKAGKVRQAMVNYLIDELDLKSKARVAIQDAHFQYGVLKVHYSAELEKNPDAGQELKADNGEIMLGDDKLPLVAPDEIPINERYVITRVHPDDIFWCEDSGPLDDDWPWIAQRFVQTIEKVRKNTNFSKAAIAKLNDGDGLDDQEDKAREARKKGGDIKGRAERMEQEGDGKKAPKMVVWYEIYDLEKNEWLCIAENGEIPIMTPETVPNGIENHPFGILRFTLRDDSPLPIPPVSPLIDLNFEYDEARSRIKRHRKRFNRKYKATGPWEDEELDKIESGDDGAIARAQPGCDIEPIKDASLDNMNYTEIGMLNKDIIEAGGSADEARGIAGSNSATQAGILDKRMEIKEGDALQMVAEWIETICKKIDQLVQANIQKDEAVKISGPQGEMWFVVRQEDYREIEGEFAYKVSVGTMTPRLPYIERASWMAFLTLLQGFPHLMTNRRLLNKMAEMHNIEDEGMIEDLVILGQQIMAGQKPMPGQGGSQAGIPDQNAARAPGGQVGGQESLKMPGAGNIEG